MRLRYYTLGAAAAAWGAYFSTASPVRGLIDILIPKAVPLESRQVVNCTDIHADFDESCWATLGLSDYLLDPITGWNATTRICSTTDDGTDSDGSDCCKPDQPWSTCFLHLAHGVAGSDCSEINAQMCSWDPTLAVAAVIAPQVRYVMRNIYVINDFFTTYYEALSFATSQAQLEISNIVNELDPTKPKGIPWFDILTALSFGLAFLGAPTIAVSVLNLEANAKIAAQTMLISLQQAPGSAKALMPSGDSESKFYQIGELESKLGDAVSELKGMINAAVEKLMSDMPTFVKFVESGKYSGQTSYSLPNQTVGLNIALKTYLVSSSMWDNGWYATPNIGPYDLDGPITCMDENNVCTDPNNSTAIYYSPDTMRSYTLNVPNGYGVTPYQLTRDLVGNQWAPLNVLFDGAFNCTMEGHAGTNNINFNYDGTLNVACISQLPILTGCGSIGNCPSPPINGTCPFGSIADTIGC
ncbi:MAG: hypothetical protein Q9195_008406 [Heterodermia aff. obscurata]